MANSRFDYVRYDEKRKKQSAAIRSAARVLEKEIDKLKDGRAKSLAMTKLEECFMWTGKACRDEQVVEAGESVDVPERG